mgnify:CR=1 FL=1
MTDFTRTNQPHRKRLTINWHWTTLADGFYGQMDFNGFSVGDIRLLQRGQTIELEWIEVEPAWRRRSIGSRMMLHAIDLANTIPFSSDGSKALRLGNLIIPDELYHRNDRFFDYLDGVFQARLSTREVMSRIRSKSSWN